MAVALQMMFVILSMAAAMYMIVVAGRTLVRRRIHCPDKGIDTDVEMSMETGGNWEPGHPLDIVRCDALENPTCVNCDKHCLHVA